VRFGITNYPVFANLLNYYLPFMKTLSITAIIYFGLILTACNSNGQVVPKHSSTQRVEQTTTNIELLKAQKALIDSFLDQHRDSVIVLVKTPNNSRLLEVKNEQWPEEIEVTYNLVKDATGRLLALLESPYSESGDWNIVLTHYFDKDGKTFAFSRQTNFFNSGCTEGVAYEVINEYYNPFFKQITKEYQLVDEKGKPLNKKGCEFPYDEPYKVEPAKEVLLKYLKIEDAR